MGQQSKLEPADGSSPISVSTDISWTMIDKWKFYPLIILSNIEIRAVLYPLLLIRTRLQVQRQKSLYNGTFDAIKKIWKFEGPGALYKGFFVYNLQSFSGVVYISLFEAIRHHINYLGVQNQYSRALVAGGCASLVAQTATVPVDVVSQHLMMLGQANVGKSKVMSQLTPFTLSDADMRNGFRRFKAICREIYKRDRLRGFYKGYWLSTMLYTTSSAAWWPFYYFYQNQLDPFRPSWMPLTVLQALCGPLAGITTTTLNNPLDACRTRLQIEGGRQSFGQAIRTLWQDDGIKFVTKGLSARLTYSCIYSLFIIVGYEAVKKLSASEEYKELVVW